MPLQQSFSPGAGTPRGGWKIHGITWNALASTSSLEAETLYHVIDGPHPHPIVAALPAAGADWRGTTLQVWPGGSDDDMTRQCVRQADGSYAWVDPSALGTTAGGAVVGGANVIRTGGSTARKIQDQLGDVISVKDYGAKGDGSADDADAFEEALAAIAAAAHKQPQGTLNVDYQDLDYIAGFTLYIPPGEYGLSRASFGGSSFIPKLRIRGGGRNACMLLTPDDEYFYDYSGNVYDFAADGFVASGGKGAFRFSGSTTIGRLSYRFYDLSVIGYSEAAIAQINATDWGRLFVDDCRLFAKDDSGIVAGKGIVWAGYIDNTEITHSAFHKCAVAIKFNRSASRGWIKHNSFLSALDGDGRVAVWIVPELATANANFGEGMTIADNRRGNEHLGNGDIFVLIADEDAGSGADFASRTPSTVASTGVVRGLKVRDNAIFGGSNSTRCNIVTYTADLRACDFDKNCSVTTPGTFEIREATARADYASNGRTVIVPHIVDAMPALARLNHLGRTKVIDIHGFYGCEPSVPRYWMGGGDDPAFKELIGPETGITWTDANAVSHVSGTDEDGGSAAVKATFTANGTSTGTTARLRTQAVDVSNYLDRVAYLTVAVKKASSSALTVLDVALIGATKIHHRRTLNIPDDTLNFYGATWEISGFPAAEAISIGFIARDWATGAQTDVIISAEAIAFYVSNERVPRGHIRGGGLAWNGKRIIAGANHLWKDSGGVLRLKGSAPASDTDGNPLALQVAVPATKTASGSPGQWAVGGGYLYTCTGTNTWQRVAIADW